jgi:hypothetical protein
MKPGYCPHCGQRLTTRHGVRLTGKQAEIFDVIERGDDNGDGGIQPARLMSAVYPGVPHKHAYNRIKVNISNINNKFALTDIRVRSGGWNVGYRVVRIVPRQAPQCDAGATP